MLSQLLVFAPSTVLVLVRFVRIVSMSSEQNWSAVEVSFSMIAYAPFFKSCDEHKE